jgi:transmembrane sensor
MLAAGDIARTGGDGVLVTEKPLPEVEEALSWRSGYIMLRNATLADAINEFNRYNERQLVLGDPSLADLHIGGNLRLTNVDAFVHILEQGFPIRAQFEGERISLNRR